jgi:hypothetical protein
MRQKKVLFITVIIIDAVFILLFFGCISTQESDSEQENIESGTMIWKERKVLGSIWFFLWHCITSSSNGMSLAAGAYGGYIYTSNDGGVRWTERMKAGSRHWISITSSSDGLKLAAVVFNGYIYTSNDGGAIWIKRTEAERRYWLGIVSSSDGLKLAAAGGGYICISIDGGITWIEQTGAGSRWWQNITLSSDGLKLAAVCDWEDNIFIGEYR